MYGLLESFSIKCIIITGKNLLFLMSCNFEETKFSPLYFDIRYLNVWFCKNKRHRKQKRRRGIFLDKLFFVW